MQAKYLVTGGGGFLGKALCLKLKELGHEVISISRSDYPELHAAGVATICHDISKPWDKILEKLIAVNGVFHTASKVDMWGKYDDFYQTNFVGTKNVIDVCKKLTIKRLVYTSSPSVIADGSNTAGVDESYPYPSKYMAFYPATKALAEREVLNSNSTDLFTLALRPHLIWGPGDTHLVPMVLARARKNKLIRIGSGKNLVDTSFITDCVAAHINAMQALDTNSNARGRPYFISQCEPVRLWGWIDQILKLNNVALVSKSLPAGVAKLVAGILETICNCLPNNPEPIFTRFLASQMSTDHYFNIDSAKRELGYKPEYSIEQAMKVTFG
ncbi:MAG: NAD-dependent epimerase/dehydratase family protein [bacterium]|nr:NAD-dependent epimerase/dehydratase family protein [bacterium]